MRILRPIGGLLFLAWCSASAAAQCSTSWDTGAGLAGTDTPVQHMVRWDPDGPGPATPVLVCGGAFTTFGSLAASGLGTWDPATGAKSVLQPSLGPVTALAAGTNGELYVARGYAQNSSPRIERWTGSGWQVIHQSNGVHALCIRANGNLIAAVVTQFGSGIYEQVGTTWNPLGTVSSGYVVTVAPLANGSLIASLHDNFYGNSVIRLNGGIWSNIGPQANGIVTSLLEMPNGDIVAGGRTFLSVAPFNAFGATVSPRLARWNGTAWTTIGTNGDVASLQAMANGDLVVNGYFDTVAGVTAPRSARWNGTTWQPIVAVNNGAATASVATCCEIGNGLAIGGAFRMVAGVPAQNVAIPLASGWGAIAPGTDGFDGQVHAIATLPQGGCVVGGEFGSVGNLIAPGIARWNGTAWAPLGAGTDGPVLAVTALPNGEVVAGGGFSTAGGVPAAGVARWDGAVWHDLPGAPFTTPVARLATMPNGDVIAADAQRLAQWDGTSWRTLGPGVNTVNSLVVRNGQLFAAGSFSGNPATVALWNGTNWSHFLAPISGAGGVALMPNGDLVACTQSLLGMMLVMNPMRWDGTAWTGFGSYLLAARFLTATPDGDVVATSFGSTLRWNGQTWTPLAAANRAVETLVAMPDGTMLAGGSFTSLAGRPAGNFARLASNCPALASVIGSGCVGSAGPLTLTPTSLPWFGGEFRAVASGLPAQSLALAVTSLQATTIPLAQVLPVGGPGCVGLQNILLSTTIVPNGSTAATGFAIPDAPSFVGLKLYHYVASFEFGSGNLIGFTSTNQLELVLGVF